MAIQVSGSTVIHDSQDVQVSGMFTASSFVGDASQLTNLPASGGTLEATASGNLSDGSKVIVNTDGTVSVVAQTETTGPGVGSEAVFESANTIQPSAIFDSSNGKVVIAYRDQGNSGYGTAVVGTVSGTSISFGTPVVFNTALSEEISSTFDSSNNKVVIAYKDDANSGYGTAIVGTVSGTSISFGSSAVFQSGSIAYISATFDSSNNKVVIAYRGTSYYGTAIVGTVSGTSISFGSSAVYNSAGTGYIGSAYVGSGKVVITYQNDGDSAKGYVSVGTVSGTSISFGTAVKFEDARTSHTSPTYDSTNGKVVIAYQDEGNSLYGTAIVGTVSGTSISFGSAVVFESAESSFISAVYDSTNQKVVISYRDHGNSSYGTAIVGTVSGTSISFGSPFIFNSGTSWYMSTAYDSTNDKVVIAYQDVSNSSYGTAAVFGNTGFTLPQLGSPTTFNTAGSQHIVSTYDPSNQKVVIAYSDYGNSNYGTAIVGTVSGTSISFGTPVVFNSGSSPWPGIAYNSTTNQIVISYRDGANSNYGTAIVGTVSGTSISFGSETVYNTADSRYNAIAYDSSNDKVVIAFRDYTSSLQYGRAIVGTISGTSISFGSKVSVNTNGITSNLSLVYDPSNQKVVVAYQDHGNSYQGTVRVGTVSGTSISFGTPVIFDGSASDTITMAYDSTNGKIVIAYTDHTNNHYGTAVVGEVSGTSMTFGTPVVYYSTGATYYHSAAYDSTNQKVVIAFKDSTTDEGSVATGTVSGNSISFGSPVVYETSEMYYNAAVYDSSNNRVVISYMDRGDNDYGKSVVFSPLTISNNLTSENFIGVSNGAYSDGQTATIQVTGSVDDAQSGLTPGQKYYVQDNGTLGESGSVFAGTAVSASKIIVKG